MKKVYLIIAVAFAINWGIRLVQSALTYSVYVSLAHSENEMPIAARIVRKGTGALIKEIEISNSGKIVHISRKIMTKDLAVQVKTPEGWADCDYDFSVTSTGPNFELHADLTHLWIDNLDGPATELAVGDLHFPVMAHRKSNVTFPTPVRRAVSVTLAGKPIGDIQPYKKEDLFAPAYLADCSGAHRYSLKGIVYGKQNVIPGVYNYSSSEKSYSAGYLYRLASSQVDYFLEDAPASVTVKTYGPQILEEQRMKYQLARE